ncbi:MAG TPA: hypothetical protein VJJ98_06425, partial [Sedimentisphaerales bacterium]|nr:hypothetical protein [Sedimentisphaerales bacterium]
MATNCFRRNHCQGWARRILIVLWLCCCVTVAEGGVSGPSSAEQGLFQIDKGTAALAEMGIERIVFVTRLSYDDPHWYANIAYYCDDENHRAYAGNGKPDESKLYALNTRTGQIAVLFDAKDGGIRDATVHYDGKAILFSYRPAGTENYSLYEI